VQKGEGSKGKKKKKKYRIGKSRTELNSGEGGGEPLGKKKVTTKALFFPRKPPVVKKKRGALWGKAIILESGIMKSLGRGNVWVGRGHGKGKTVEGDERGGLTPGIAQRERIARRKTTTTEEEKEILGKPSMKIPLKESREDGGPMRAKATTSFKLTRDEKGKD